MYNMDLGKDPMYNVLVWRERKGGRKTEMKRKESLNKLNVHVHM